METLKLTTLIDEAVKLAEQKKLKGIYQKDTAKNLRTKADNLRGFMSTYNLDDTLAKDVNVAFTERYKRHLMNHHGVKIAHTNKCIRFLKGLLKEAVLFERIDKNKIEGFNTNIPVVFKNNHLELEQLEKIEKMKGRFTLMPIRDLYVFCCWEGLAFGELRDFDPNRHIVNIDGREFITMIRHKTIEHGQPFFVPLFPRAKEILLKYKYKLPSYSCIAMNKGLKEIGRKCGIRINMTTHTARKTFCIVMTEKMRFTIEAVSYMLGHKDLRTTQKHYHRVRLETVKNELMRMPVSKIKAA